MSGLVNLERTLALIKPDANENTQEIIRLIRNSGFSILSQRRVILSPEQGNVL
jgi:nucleoside diphosphate kinase